MTKKNATSKYMSEYEVDLTYDAARYAVGRSTIHAQDLAKQMMKNVYGRMEPNMQIHLSKDIRRNMAAKMQYYPFEFYMPVISDNPRDYWPMDKFIEWMGENNINVPEDLASWNHITYLGDGKYEATQNSKPADYVTTSFDDLLVWDRLAKLLDYNTHKFCKIIYRKEGVMTEDTIEYIEFYIRDSYKTLSYHKVKVPVKSLISNPYVIETIDEDTIDGDELSAKKVSDWHKEYGLPSPVALEYMS